MPLSIGTFNLGSSSTIPSGFSSANAFTVAATGLTTINGNIAKKNGSGTIKGVVVFFSIGDGSSYWLGTSDGANTAQFFTDLAAAGYHSVMVKFTGGWTLSANGVASGQVALAIRPATVIKWVYDNWYLTLSPLPAPGLGATGFCVTGVSGGSSAGAYALEMYYDPSDSKSIADITNYFIPTSGPPMAQIGKGCKTGFTGYTYSTGNYHLIDNSYGYDDSYGNEASGPCLLHTNTGGQDTIWASNSNDTCGTDYTYPTTRVHMILGADDITAAPTHAEDYYTKLYTAGQTLLSKESPRIAGMDHVIQDYQSGVNALYAAIIAPAVPTGPPPRVSATLGYSDVNAVINGGTDSNMTIWTAADNGEIVVLPGGIADWTQQLVISKAITLQGQSDVIGDHNVTGTDDWLANTPPRTVQSTIIRDAIPQPPPGSNGPSLIKLLNPAGSGVCRITGITFRDAGIHANFGTGLIQSTGPDKFRIDHCEFDNIKNYAVYAFSEQGLVDHCSAINFGNVFVHQTCDTWGGSPNIKGDGSYGAALNLGGSNAFYVEDCYYHTTAAKAVTDGESGARFVVRFCVIVGGGCQNHGAESGNHRSGRKFENYRNRYLQRTGASTQNAYNFYRGGTGVVFDNTGTGGATAYQSVLTLINYRDCKPQTWGPSDGTSGWDINDPAGVILSGVHSATGGTDSRTLKVDSVTWTTDQWKYHTIKNLDRLNTLTTPYPRFASITGNTTGGIISTTDSQEAATVLKFSPGERFEIRRVFHSVDHCGAGQSDLLTPSNHFTPHDIHQIREPIYCFNNLLGGVLKAAQTSYNIRENVDFYNQTNSFTGASGIGRGTLAARPLTCSMGIDPATGVANVLGVGYWATDEGEWDSTSAGFDGQLYVCTAQDTWSLYYKPYMYPHGLISNAVDTPVLTPPAGTYVVTGSTKVIAASCSTTGAQMRYTTDGTTIPTATVGTLIAGTSGNITLGLGTTTVQIIAFASGMELSSVNSSVYTVSSATTRIISLGTPIPGQTGLVFGSIIIGLTGSQTLRITNTGSAALNISSITYPTGYTGAYAGAIAPDSFHDVTVVLTPVSAIAYNGTITVNSDKTSGTNTITTAGRGVAASGGGGILPGTQRKIALMTS